MKKIIFTAFNMLIICTVLFSQEFKEHIISTSEMNISGLFIADINKDNNNDIISTSFSNDIAWWEKENNSTNWTKHIIDNKNTGALYIYAADINRDSYVDVIASKANDEGNELVWYKNDGSSFNSWVRTLISDNLENGHGVYAGDIDSDGDMDVVATSVAGNKISWFENSAENGDGSTWIEHAVIQNLTESQTVCLADVNNDTYLDIVGGSSKNNLIVCLINSGTEEISWTKVTIDNNIGLPHWVDTIDMDHDGDIDIFASGYSTHEISWYENDLENNDWIVWAEPILLVIFSLAALASLASFITYIAAIARDGALSHLSR